MGGGIIRFVLVTIRHKWFVMTVGLKIGTPLWRILSHDLTKFLPSELPHYGRHFFGDRGDPEGFDRCWLRHQNRNDHHWEFWIPRSIHNRSKSEELINRPMEMEEGAVREMVADWLGAGRVIDEKWPDINNWPWLKKNMGRVILHPATRKRVEELIRKWAE